MNNKIIVTVLGCGSSGGVPRIDGDWGNCNPDEPNIKEVANDACIKCLLEIINFP